MPTLIFWTSAASVIYAYVIYPLLCALIGKVLPLKRVFSDDCPTLTLIIPCYNEEKIIREKIENCLALGYPREKLQVIIASESVDGTNRIAAQYAHRGIELRAFTGRLGKSRMLSIVIPDARGEIIVLSDANVMLKDDALRQLARNFGDIRVGAAAGVVSVTNQGSSSISWAEAAYKRYETALRSSNSLRGSVLNPDGALFALRKRCYRPITPERGDDFELVLRVLLQRQLSVLEPAAIAFEDASTAARAEVNRKVRMVSWFMKSAILLCAEAVWRLRFGIALQIISHKLLRWLTPFFLLAAFASSLKLGAHSQAYLAAFIAQCAVILMGWAGWYLGDVRKKKPPLALRASWYLLVFNYAFLAGILKSLLPGGRSPYWEKARI